MQEITVTRGNETYVATPGPEDTVTIVRMLCGVFQESFVVPRDLFRKYQEKKNV